MNDWLAGLRLTAGHRSHPQLMLRLEPRWAGLDDARAVAAACLHRLITMGEENRAAAVEAGAAAAASSALSLEEWRSPAGRAACAAILQEMVKDAPWTG